MSAGDVYGVATMYSIVTLVWLVLHCFFYWKKQRMGKSFFQPLWRRLVLWFVGIECTFLISVMFDFDAEISAFVREMGEVSTLPLLLLKTIGWMAGLFFVMAAAIILPFGSAITRFRKQ